MGLYYIKTQNDDYYELDSTSDVAVNYNGRATDFPLEDGESAADHYINENTRITFSGVISDAKTALTSSNERSKSSEDYIKGLLKTKESKVPFTIFYANKLEPIENCLFESLELNQTSRNGTSGEVSSYRVSFTAVQIRFGEAAQMVEAPAKGVEKSTAKKSAASGNTNSLNNQQTQSIEDRRSEVKSALQGHQQYREGARQ